MIRGIIAPTQVAQSALDVSHRQRRGDRRKPPVFIGIYEPAW